MTQITQETSPTSNGMHVRTSTELSDFSAEMSSPAITRKQRQTLKIASGKATLELGATETRALFEMLSKHYRTYNRNNFHFE